METKDVILEPVSYTHLDVYKRQDTGCAIVIIAHMNKMRDTNPLYRTNGSIDIAGCLLYTSQRGNEQHSSPRV